MESFLLLFLFHSCEYWFPCQTLGTFGEVPCHHNRSFSVWFSRFLRQTELNICFISRSHRLLSYNFVIVFPLAILCSPLFPTPLFYPAERLTEYNPTEASVHTTCYLTWQGFGFLPVSLELFCPAEATKANPTVLYAFPITVTNATYVGRVYFGSQFKGIMAGQQGPYGVALLTR